MRILWGITGSFCNHEAVFEQIEHFIQAGHDIQCVFSNNSYTVDNRFSTAEERIDRISRMTGHKIIHTLKEAEMTGPSRQYDACIVAPATATFISKLNQGIYDDPVLLSVKSMLRNQKALVLAIASNDFLGNSSINLFQLLQKKNVYITPFYQDDPLHKPNSLISRFDLIEAAFDSALNHIQIQPLLAKKKEG